MTAEDFAREVLPLKNKIFRFSKRLLGRPFDAEDATQDVFVKLWSKRESLSGYRSVEALAMTMTRNLCLDRIRSGQRRQTEAIDNNDPSPEASPQQQAEVSNGLDLVRTLIDQLPEKQKTIVQLREIEGYEFKEIAEVTGMTVNAIKVNLTRARQRIREELKQTYAYGLPTDQ